MSTASFWVSEMTPCPWPNAQLFFPEVRYGGHVVESEDDIPNFRLGDRLRARVREIVSRPSRVSGWCPPLNVAGDADWREVRRHHHREYGLKVSARPVDHHRDRVALSYGIAEPVADALFRPMLDEVERANRFVEAVATMYVNRADFWAPRSVP